MAREFLALAIVLGACADDGSAPNEDASVPLDAAACVKQCGPDQTCDEVPLALQPTFDETLTEWKLDCSDGGNLPLLFAGTCDEKRVLTMSFGKGSRSYYFDADGGFVTMRHDVDYSRPPCGASTYWPTMPSCNQQTVAETYCGSR